MDASTLIAQTQQYIQQLDESTSRLQEETTAAVAACEQAKRKNSEAQTVSDQRISGMIQAMDEETIGLIEDLKIGEE